MANTAVVATRRDDIAARWLKGQAVAAIARELDTPLGTVKHDLVYIRRELLTTQGDVVRLTRARTMAALELVAAHAWQRVDVLTAQSEPDEHALGAYLALVARTQAQIAKLAGVGKLAEYLERQVVSRDLCEWVDEHAEEAQRRQVARMLGSYASYEVEDDEDDEDDGGGDGSVREEELIQRVNDAYERGLAEGRDQAHAAAMAAIREVAEQVRAEAAPPASEPDETDETDGWPPSSSYPTTCRACGGQVVQWFGDELHCGQCDELLAERRAAG